ncbi:Protein CBG10772 [Caenorhabditis briggsae]|uniref:Protein CBG10772 n=1 Tax=Caenorhabditis briggsae TaxID=6238 RepID=A8XBR7_CAEBR|nr:Protein CBG10772 [Caenorhabditis briggsae]CAP30083.2 Protein CBG10772 [Caenorhabditis briggsae]
MNLSKYPNLVQKEILDNMNHIGILLLSFVSKNMRKLIKSSQKKRFESIRSIEYNYNRMDGKTNVCIRDGHNYKFPLGVNDLLLSMFKHDGSKNYCFQLNVSGKIIGFKLTDYHKYPVASYPECEKESVIQSIHNHFLDVFRNSMEYYWQARLWHWPQEAFIPFLPKLKNVSFCVGMYLDGDFADVKNFDKFFSLSPVLKTIQLSVNAKTEPLSPESKFYDTESIHIHTPQFNGPDYLRHFRGKHIGLYCNRYEKSDLIDLVNRWKSGEAFQNLEYLWISVVCYENRFPNRILNEIGAKYINATKQPPTHTVLQR